MGITSLVAGQSAPNSVALQLSQAVFDCLQCAVNECVGVGGTGEPCAAFQCANTPLEQGCCEAAVQGFIRVSVCVFAC